MHALEAYCKAQLGHSGRYREKKHIYVTVTSHAAEWDLCCASAAASSACVFLFLFAEL